MMHGPVNIRFTNQLTDFWVILCFLHGKMIVNCEYEEFDRTQSWPVSK